jgi:YfiR/HmsC-like
VQNGSRTVATGFSSGVRRSHTNKTLLRRASVLKANESPRSERMPNPFCQHVGQHPSEGSNVTVVGHSPHLAERGGKIQLFLEDNQIRFFVNVDCVNRAPFQMSSQLLALAKILHGRRQ